MRVILLPQSLIQRQKIVSSHMNSVQMESIAGESPLSYAFFFFFFNDSCEVKFEPLPKLKNTRDGCAKVYTRAVQNVMQKREHNFLNLHRSSIACVSNTIRIRPAAPFSRRTRTFFFQMERGGTQFLHLPLSLLHSPLSLLNTEAFNVTRTAFLSAALTDPCLHCTHGGGDMGDANAM